jgi:hypothetical protein
LFRALYVIEQIPSHFLSCREANLRSARLETSKFSSANLTGAHLTYATLAGVNLREANLSGANLQAADLGTADLSNANLSKANLILTDLTSAKCYNTNLSGADLGMARLIYAKLDGAILNDVRLWGTQYSGWSIKGVICECVFWGREGEEKMVYRPGEFERLFADKTIVRLFYKDGINPLEIATIPALIKHLEDSHPGSGLRLVGIREDSGGVVAELAIEGADNQSPEELKHFKEALETEAQQKVEYQRQALTEREIRLKVEGRLEELRSCFHLLASKNHVNVQGDYMGDTHQNYGQTSGMGRNVHAHDNTFNQVVNHFEKIIDLPTLATQLAELREEMAKDSSPQSAIAQGETAKAEIAAQSGDTSKVMEHLKSAGKWTLDFAKEVGKDLAVEAIKLSMRMP